MSITSLVAVVILNTTMLLVNSVVSTIQSYILYKELRRLADEKAS